MKFNIHYLSLLLIYSLPISLMSGPAIPDISITLVGILFLIYAFKNSDFYWLRIDWIKAGIIFWISLILISFFSINKSSSFIDSLIFIRYIILSAAVYYWLITDDKRLKVLLLILFSTIIFVLLDCAIQFFRYDPLIGFGADIFGYLPTDYGRLTGPFNDQVPGSHLSKFFFISLFLFLYFYKDYKYTKIIISLYYLSTGIIIFLSGERMAIATFLLGSLIFIFLFKDYRKLFLFLIITLFISILAITKNHTSFNDFKVIESSPHHLGLILEKEYNCENNKKLKCFKEIKVQPKFISVLSNFKESVYYKIYSTSYKMWLDNKITGVGLNNYEEVCKNNKKYKIISKNYGNCSSHPHNFYLQWLIEAGIIGSLMFIIFIFYIFKSFYKSRHLYSSKIGFISLVIIFWPIMSTGSLLKNWHGIGTFFIIGISLLLSKKLSKTN